MHSLMGVFFVRKIFEKTIEKLLTNTGRGCIIKVRKDKREYENDQIKIFIQNNK